MLTLILKENELQELLELIYRNTDRVKNMTETIKDTANKWKNNNPTNQNEIVEQIIDNINI